jgi:hypothetical protein
MSGLADHGLPAFAEATQRLTDAGYTAVNPGRRGVIEGFDWADYMRAALIDLCGCDAVALLPGWRESKGVALEMVVASALHMPARTVNGWLRRAAVSTRE